MDPQPKTVVAGSEAEARPATVPLPTASEPDVAGTSLGRLTVLPALLSLAFLLVSFPLLLLGWFRPLPVSLAGALAAAIVLALWWRCARTRAPARARAPWWPTAALIVIAVAFGVYQARHHSQSLIVTRDPAAYIQFAVWLQRHGSLPITPSASAFGGLGTGSTRLQLGSVSFYGTGDVISPMFMAGLPMALAAGYWAGGISGAFLMAPLLGAAAVLTFGGLAARLVGARWAPLAALGLALSLPMMNTSRETFSEPFSEVLFLGGLCLLVDSLRVREQPGNGRFASRTLAALAGLCLGIVFVVRLDGPSDILLLVPYCGFLFLLRKPQAIPVAIGAFAGLVYGLTDALDLARPYALVTNLPSTEPLAEIFAVVVALTVLGVLVGVRLRRRRGWPAMPGWLPGIAAVVPFIVLALFAVRPYVQNAAALKDAPLSLRWVSWYAGWPVIAAAGTGAGLLLRRLLRGRDPEWLGPFCMLAWSMAEFLYRPGVAPDQPWAARRMVPAVLPGFFLFATWLAAWAVRRARGREWSGAARRWSAAGLAAVAAAALLIPAVRTTFNLHVDTADGVKLAADGWAAGKLYQGETAAIYGICDQLPRNAVVLLVEESQTRDLTETLRGMCDVPAAGVPQSTRPSGVEAIMKRARAAGSTPVLMASDPDLLKPYPGGAVKEVMALKTTGDPSDLTQWPHQGGQPFAWFLYMWEAK